MKELEALKESLSKENDFIGNMFEYITDHIDTAKASIISEAERLILEFNIKIVEEKRRKLARLEETLTIKEEPFKTEVRKEEFSEEPPYPKQRKEYMDFIIKMLQEEKTIAPIINSFNEQEIKECTLAIFEEILKLEEEIKESIIEDASKSILPLQQKLILLKNLLKRINKEAKPKEEENVLSEVTTQSKTKVLFLPNGKGSTYFAEDLASHLEKSEEIRNAFTKIASGYFLKSKDTKPLKDRKEKLYEYTNPNGIRILYIVMGESTYAICGLFYKNKQKSTKITEYYEEAIRRFASQREYLEENLNNPNLYIEQAELVGELYTILENKTPTLKEVL